MALDSLRSPEINEVTGALAAAQGSYKLLKANQDAPGGKFANLQAILDAVRESLSSNGLAFFQYIDLLDEGSGAALLKTVLSHSSGQFISSTARVVRGKNDRQTGNIYEIHKRLHALMILGIAPSSSDPVAFDDNGEELAEYQLMEDLKKPTKESDKKEKNSLTIPVNASQYNEIMIELDGHPKIAKDMMESYNIETIADLPQEEYHKALARIRKIKHAEAEYDRNRR